MFSIFISIIQLFSIKEYFLAIAFLLIGYSIPFAHYEYSLYKKDLYLKEKGIVEIYQINKS